MDEELRDIRFGFEGTPFRRSIRVRVAFDEDGIQRIDAVEGKTFTLSEEGSVDQVEISQVDRFYSCGCVRTEDNLGGQCAASEGCSRTSCFTCFSLARCHGCKRPLCLAHVRFLDLGNGEPTPLCAVCESKVPRSFLHRFANGFLPPPAP